MKKIKLGKTGLNVTPVGFGVLTVGPWQMNLPLAEGSAVLRYALERGINFMDTAQYYKTYPYIKEALLGWNKEVIIASKSLDTSYDEMMSAIEECRKEIQRDVIDIFMLHEVREGSDFDDRAGAFSALQDAKAKGVIKAAGVSTHHVDVAQRMAVEPGVDILFPLINFKSLGIRKGTGTGTKEEMAAAIQKAADRGLGVFAMKVFGGGNLTPYYSEAIQYVRNLPGIHSMMMGFGHKYEVDAIIDLLEGRLLDSYKPQIAHKKIRIDQGDCLGCGACKERCPNHAIYMNNEGLAQVDHNVCLTCGYCAPICPAMAIIMF